MDLTGSVASYSYLSADCGAYVCGCESSLLLLDFIGNAQKAVR